MNSDIGIAFWQSWERSQSTNEHPNDPNRQTGYASEIFLTYSHFACYTYANMVNGVIGSNVQDDTWLSIGEAAELVGVSRDTLRRWEKKGKVKVYRTPTNRRTYKQSELEELFKPVRKSQDQRTTQSQDQKAAEPVVKAATPTSPTIPTAQTEEVEPVVALEAEKTTPGAAYELKEAENAENEQSEESSSEAEPAPLIPSIDHTGPEVQDQQESESEEEPDLELKKETPELETEPEPEHVKADPEPAPKATEVEAGPTAVPESAPPLPTTSISMPAVPAPNAATSMTNVMHDAGEVVVEENKSMNVLKVVAMVLALILVGLGITITVLVFI